MSNFWNAVNGGGQEKPEENLLPVKFERAKETEQEDTAEPEPFPTLHVDAEEAVVEMPSALEGEGEERKRKRLLLLMLLALLLLIGFVLFSSGGAAPKATVPTKTTFEKVVTTPVEEEEAKRAPQTATEIVTVAEQTLEERFGSAGNAPAPKLMLTLVAKATGIAAVEGDAKPGVIGLTLISATQVLLRYEDPVNGVSAMRSARFDSGDEK